MFYIELTNRQKEIVEIVKENQPITSDQIAEKMNITRSTLRTDLSVLTMIGILDARPKVGYYFSGNTEAEVISEKIKKVLVSEIKSLPTVIDEQTTLYDAIVTLFLEDTSGLYVVSNGYLGGVVSRKDLLKNIMGGTDMNKVPVGMFMTRMPNIITIRDSDTALEAAIKIIEHEVDSLPVTEEVTINGKKYHKITGKVSKTNITRLLVDLARMKI
ncbi:MAG: helix-turn-helix transcriptional regulator [Clostridiales bacterium]|nr:helix-turn-helix transcriptional regulator [Clostridiales bacterium]